MNKKPAWAPPEFRSLSKSTGNPGSLFVSQYGFHNMNKYREHMGRSLGLEIC